MVANYANIREKRLAFNIKNIKSSSYSPKGGI